MENEMEQEELTPEEKARRVEEFFAKKRAQNAGEEAAPEAATVRHADGMEERVEMGSVAGAEAMGAAEGVATGALKGAGRNAVKFAQAVVHEGSNVLKAAGFVPQLLGWDGLHLVADEMNEVAKGWGEAAALDYGYEDWGTKTGDAFGLLDSISGSLLTMRTLKTGGPNAMATVMGGSAAADTLSNARKSGHGFLRTAAEVGWNGGLNFFLGKLFANQTIEKLFKIPEMQGPMAERLTKEGIGKGIKGFGDLVKAVRNGSVSEILLKRGVGALKAGGIMGLQSFVTALGDQYAKEDVKPVEEMSDDELREAKGQIDAWEAEQAKAAAEGRDPDVELKPEWEKDLWDRMAVGLKAGLHGAGEGALMEGVMGAGELALTMKEARKQTAAAIRRLIATPKGRAFMAAQNADAMGVVEGVAREGGTLTKAQLDAAGLPPDMPMREVRRLAFELKRDTEMADARREMETEEYRKRAELAERIVKEQGRDGARPSQEGEWPLEFETEEQKAEAERALQERKERIDEARADEMVAGGQGMADTLFGEESGILVRRGTAEERRAAAEGAVGKGADARTLKDAEGQVCGYWDRGKNEVVLFGNADAKTVAHELGWHATRQWAEKNSPELLAKMNEYAQSCPPELRAEIEAAYPDFARNPDALLDEIGAGRFEREMGAKFGEMLERSPEAKRWWQGLKDMIAEAWRGMVKALGGKGAAADAIDLKALEAMTPEKGMEWLVGQMAEGKRIGGGENGGFDFSSRREPQRAQSGEVRYSRRVAAVEDSEIEKSLDAVIGRTVTREGGKALKIKEREGEEGKIRAEAQKVFKALKDERIPLPNGGELYFAPDERTVKAYGGSVPDAWAEYCIHLVTHGVTNAETGERYRAFSEANVEKVLPAIRETVAADQVSIDRKESRIIFYRQTETGTSNNKSKFQKVVAEIDENGDVRIDLRYITGMERRGRIPGRLTTLEDALASGPTQGGATTDASSSTPTLKGQGGLSPHAAGDTSKELGTGRIPANSEDGADYTTGGEAAQEGAKVSPAGQTDTRQFKNFFGDWESDPANASKVVDENGKPLVVWHGSADNGFTQFDPARIREKDGVQGFYFSPPERRDSVAGYYGHGDERAFYLNIRKPLVIGPDEKPTQEDLKGHDGIIRMAQKDWQESRYYNWRTGAVETERIKKGDIIEIVAFEPEQVKSATDNIGTFDQENPDIRYQRRTAEEERALKSALGSGTMRGVEQKRLTEVIRGLEAGRLKHPRFTKEEAAASKGTEHGKLWNYILSLESADVHAGGGGKGASGVGNDAAKGGEGLGQLGRMATRYGSDPQGLVEDSFKYLDEGAESRVYVADGGKKVLKIRKLSAYDINGVKDALSKIIYHNYLFPNDAYTLRDIAVWKNKGHDEFYVLLEQPLVTPKTDAKGNIIAPSEDQIRAALQKTPMRFSEWDEKGSESGTSSADYVPSARKIAYNGDFMVYDFKPGRNTFIDAKTGEVRFIDPRVELNDPEAGFSVSKFGRRNAKGRVEQKGEDRYADYTGYEDEDRLSSGAPGKSPAQIRPQRRTAEEEIERTERALKAVREGRVRVADSGGTAGEASEPGRAAGEELLAAQSVAPRDDRSVSNPVSLPMSGMVGLYRALRSNPSLPKVLTEAKRRGAAWVSRLTKGSDVELNPEAFGIIDDTVRDEIKEEMKSEGMFRNEDPVWNMKHSKSQCEDERIMSEHRLEDRLNTLAQDITAGRKPGGQTVARGALAHEIGQLIMAMPKSERLRTAAGKDGAKMLKDMKTLGDGVVKAVKSGIEEAAKATADAGGEEFHSQEVEAVAWWRGATKGEAELMRIGEQKGEEALKAEEAEENRAKAALAKNPDEVAGELFGMFLAAPETLRERAPDAFRRIVDAMGENEALANAYARIANADAPTEVMAKIREQWTHEAQVELRGLERETDRPLGTVRQRVKRRAILNLHSKEGPAVSIVDDALQERVAEAKRALKVAKKGGDRAEIARAERNLEAVKKDARDQMIDLKMGVLKKQRGGGMEREYALNMANRVMEDIARDGVELEDLRTYMKAKWCIALQGRADSFGMSPLEANQVIEAMRTRLGDADFMRLERAQRRFGEERRKAILDNPDVVAAFGPALVDAWRKNTDYVRSERILSAQQVKEYKAVREEWLRKNPGQADVLGDIELMVEMHRVRHGGSDGSVFAKPLEGSFKATGDPLAYTMAYDMHILQFARRNALVMQIADVAKELSIEGFKEVSDANLGRALEGSNRYGSVAFMRGGERKLLIMPKVAAEGFKAMGEGDVAGLVKANRMVSAILTQYSPRFAWRNMFRNRQAVENNIPWMRESRLQTASRYFGVGPLAKLAEHLMERAVVRLPDGVMRNAAMNLVWGENTTMYWIGEATRIAKLMFDPKGIRNLAERADAAAANGDIAAAQAIMEDIAKAREMMKKPIFAGQWRMMMGQADRADLDAVFAALDMRTNFTGERFEGLRRAARAAKGLADTVRRFNTFEEARIKIVAELAAERARNNAAAEGSEFRYSQKEVDYLTATMAGSPRYEMRGRWMNVLEAIPFGPFANVGMKGAWRTVESMRTDPKAWTEKAAHRIAGRMAEIALWGAGGYALVAAIARRMFGDNEDAQRAIDGFESFGKRMARARACISDYRLRNYDIVPLGLYGEWCSFGINMPRGDEDRMIMPLTDTVARFLLKGDAAKRAGLHDPIDGAYTPVEAGVATLVDSGLAPDIYRGSMIWNLGKDTLYAWLQNPYNTFTKRNTYGQAVWENRFGSWSQAKDFFIETMKQAWNDVGGQVVVPATTWDEDAGDVPDEGRWVLGMSDPKDAAEMPVGGKTIFRAMHYVPMASAMLSGMFYMNCDGDARIARRLEKMQAKEKAARNAVAMRCVGMMLDAEDVSADYATVMDEAVKENGWDSMDRALIEQAIARKVREAARKMGRESVPLLDVFRKITISDRERKEMEMYLTGIGWEVE